MVSFIVRMKFSPEDRADVAETLRLLAASRQEPGCVSYIPHTVEGDPDTVLIYEQWRDAKRAGGARAVGALQEACGGGTLPEDAGTEREDLVAVVC
jgi:hypothetical protein